MGNETITITNVDTKQLEEQRRTLNYIIDHPMIMFRGLNLRRQGHIKGLSNMLNKWSDQRYHEKSTVIK